MTWTCECNYMNDGPVCTKCGNPSVASACSGADARQADNGDLPHLSSLFGLYKDSPIDLNGDWGKSEAVSPRSGDGPAWLPKYHTLLNEAYERYRGLFQSSHDRYYEGVADGLDIAETILTRLRTQGHSQKDTGEAQDGQVPPVA